jgi:hypothetical protein
MDRDQHLVVTVAKADLMISLVLGSGMQAEAEAVATVVNVQVMDTPAVAAVLVLQHITIMLPILHKELLIQ